MEAERLLTLTATSQDNSLAVCTGEDDDYIIEIKLTNNTGKSILLPLDYIKKTGPTITLKDSYSKKTITLRTNLVDSQLADQLTLIAPTKSVTFKRIISSDKLEQFRYKGYIDIEAIISIYATIYIKDKPKPITLNEQTLLNITSD